MPTRLALLVALALASSACSPALGSLETAPDPLVAGAGDESAAAAVAANLPDAPAVAATPLSDDEVARDVKLALGLEQPESPEGGEASWDIAVEPYAEHERVERYVRLFAGSARARFAERLQRGTRYEPMIRGKLRAAGMPEDLYYLALVESGFEPHAYSRAAAVGLWQFMTTTARGVGLRVDWWVDERRDPVRSTDAAIRFLRSLDRQFGSLYLAAAAYNGGPGRVSRGLAKHADALADSDGDDLFFALAETGYLRAETQNYVPQIIAAALIGNAPSRYGITVEPLAPLAYDSVHVPASTPLAAVASAADVPLAEIRELNGHFLRGITPPGDSAFVRVPPMKAIGFPLRFEALPAEQRTAFTRVKSKDRGRLSAIAKQHGRTERELAWYNPSLRRAKNGLLIGGQTVLVPSASVVAAALDVADPAVERYGTSAPAKAAPRVHVVAAGDNLSTIAKRYGTSVKQLRAANKLKSDRIRPGQRLVVGTASSRRSA